MNFRRERLGLLALRHAAFNQFRIAGDARQRRFQLMRNVGRKLHAHVRAAQNFLVLLLDHIHKRFQLGVARHAAHVVEVGGHPLDRLHQPRRQQVRQIQADAGHARRQQHDERHGAEIHAPYIGCLLCQPHHVAVFQPNGVIKRALIDGAGIADIASASVLKRLPDFRPIRMIVHRVRIGKIIVIDRAVRMHERHADVLFQTVQRALRLRLAVHLDGEHPPIYLQIVHDAPLEHLIVHPGQQQRRRQNGHGNHAGEILKNLFLHSSSLHSEGGGFPRAVYTKGGRRSARRPLKLYFASAI